MLVADRLDPLLVAAVGVVGDRHRVALVAAGLGEQRLGLGRVELAGLAAGAGLVAVDDRGDQAVAGARAPLKICLMIASRSIAIEIAWRILGSA